MIPFYLFFPPIKPPMCASQEILLFCKEMNTCETNQKAIKYFAFRVVGKIIPNGTSTKSFAFGNLYKIYLHSNQAT